MRTGCRAPRLFAIALAIFGLWLAGCGHKTERAIDSDEDPTPNPAATFVDAATTGAVAGVVKLQGTPRRMRAINMASVPNCAKLHSSPVTSEDVIAGANGELENVVVYLKGNFRQYKFETPAAATLDQQGCVYHPHVVALMTGQHLLVTNSDQTTHNVNAMPKTNRRWNESQSSGASGIDEVFGRGEVGIPVKCNIHPWMRAYFAVFAHPYFQVTGADGSFTIGNVPPGTYTLTAWHEVYGTREQTITIAPKGQVNAAISFTP